MKSGDFINKIRSADFSVLATPGQSVYMVDASGASVTGTLPAAGAMQGKLVRVVCSTDPAGNSVTLNNSAASELWTGYAKGDHILITAQDGAYYILEEQVTVGGLLALQGDDAIAGASTEKIFDANYTESIDIGGWWDAVTNHRLTAAVACRLWVNCEILCSGAVIAPYFHVNGAAITDTASSAGGSSGHMAQSRILTLSASDTVEVYANNTGAGVNVLGDAALDETKFEWKLIERVR